MTERDRSVAYQPLTLARLGALLVGADESRRWRLVAEFLEEYRWEPSDARQSMLAAEPPGTGDERWDVFLAALAEHLAARDGRGAPTGESQNRCGGCGFRSTPVRHGSMRWFMRRRRFGGEGCTWPRRSWRSRKRR